MKPRKATKKYLKELRDAIRTMEEQFLNQATKPAFASKEENKAGKASRYGLKEVPVTEDDRENYRAAIVHFQTEIERVERELGLD